MSRVTAGAGTVAMRAKSAIERMGSALLAQHPDPSGVDVDRLFFELRIVLLRALILDRVGMLDEGMGWAEILELDLERALFHVEQDDRICAHGSGGGRIWSGEWVGLVRREFLLCGGMWFDEVVETVRGDAENMGAVDESLMGWSARVGVDGGLELFGAEGSERKLGGIFYTPATVVGDVLDRALSPSIASCGGDVERLLSLRVCDPACGCGYFLIEASRRIAARVEVAGGGDRMGAVVSGCVFGGDVHPVTAEVCRWALWFESGDRWLTLETLRSNIRCADSLVDGAFEAGSMDVVVGNPPFLNQLGSGTARSSARVKSLRARGLVGAAAYTDEASAFFVLGLQMAKFGGRVCMVQPQSVLATKGGAWMRRRVAEVGRLESVWVSNAHVFGDASVYTCAPCVVVGEGGDDVLVIGRSSGAGFEVHSSMRISRGGFGELETWSSVAAVTMGVPEINIASSGIVGDVAGATADFRDEYYGLAGKLAEDSACAAGDGSVRVVTTGLIDLGVCRWGEKATRILKRRWEAPRVSGAAIGEDARLARWVAARGVEKVLVATQTRVVEAYVDAGEGLVAVTPMITVVMRERDEDTACLGRSSRGTLGCADGVDVWMIGAAVGSPVCSVFAMRHYGGAAMHADALKMSARQVMGLPLPGDHRAWRAGAEAFERVHAAGKSVRDDQRGYEEALIVFGGVMCSAYGVEGTDRGAVMGWWLGRLGIGGNGSDFCAGME